MGNRLRNQITIHAAMTEDLWPSRFSNRERQADFALQAVNYLLYQELKEKLTSAWPQRRDMLLEQEGERDNVLRLTQERLLSRENDLNRVQGLLQESDREGQEKTRLVREKENELNLAKETAKQEIKRLKDRLDQALDEQRKTEVSLQEVRADADQAINLAQENVEKARAKLLKAEQDLLEERAEGERVKEELLTFQRALDLTKNELLSVQEKSENRIKKAETLAKLANIVTLKTGKELAEKEQMITKLSEEKEKIEIENKESLSIIEKNAKEMSLLRESFDEFKNKFANKNNEVIVLNHELMSLNHQFVLLKENMRLLESHCVSAQEALKHGNQNSLRLQENVDKLSIELKEYKGRVKELKDALEKEKEVSRLAQQEIEKKYESLFQNAKKEEIGQLKLQHDEELKELSNKFVALTQELESVRRKRDEVEVLYEQAGEREKEALLKLNELQQEFNEAWFNLSAISPNITLNNSPLDKSFLGDIKESLGGMENMIEKKMIHNQSIQVNPLSLMTETFNMSPMTIHSYVNKSMQVNPDSLNKGENQIKPFKKLEDMTVYESEYGYDDSKGNFQPFDNSKNFAESKLINQSVLKENPQIKEQIKKESEDMIDLSSLHIQDKSKSKFESESFEIVDKSVSLEDPNKKK